MSKRQHRHAERVAGFTLFEMLVIGLQAYVFALLTAVYIDLALHADSH